MGCRKNYLEESAKLHKLDGIYSTREASDMHQCAEISCSQTDGFIPVLISKAVEVEIEDVGMKTLSISQSKI